MRAGRFITIYGINNIGKSTQCALLTETLSKKGHPVKFIKYPIYEFEPSGVMINEYLRKENPYNLSRREIQLVYTFNRAQYEPTLKLHLSAGTNVIAEDYWETGVGWGTATGVDKEFLLRINTFCHRENLAILLSGKRFETGKEKQHLHENKDEMLMEKVQEVFLEIAQEFNWKVVDANRPPEVVAEEIWKIVEPLLS